MRNKIKEALKQKYGTRANKELGQLQLGLGEEVFERVAASVETFITEESAIEAWVNSEATLNLLKSYQSEADRARAQARAVNAQTPPAGSEGQGGGQESGQTSGGAPQHGIDMDALAKVIADQVAAANKPLYDQLATMQAERAKAAAESALDSFIGGWDYAKGFQKESDTARRIALKLYKAGGEKMTGEELIAAYREEFDPAVREKGVTDFTKPFRSEGEGEGDADFTSFDRAMEKLGWNKPAPENKQ